MDSHRKIYLYFVKNFVTRDFFRDLIPNVGEIYILLEKFISCWRNLYLVYHHIIFHTEYCLHIGIKFPRKTKIILPGN